MRYQEFEHAVTEKITILETVNRRCRHKGGYPRYVLDLMLEDAQAIVDVIKAYRRALGGTDDEQR